MTVIFRRNITMGTCVFRPVCSLSPITPMVGFSIVMPAYHRQRTHKFVSWSSLRWIFMLLLYALCCVMPALFVSMASYHIVVNELIEGIRIQLVQLIGRYSNIGFSENLNIIFWIIGHNIVIVDVLVTTWPRISAAAMLAWIFGFESLNFCNFMLENLPRHLLI